MPRLDVKDKDPFAHADDEPKDNISTGGFVFENIYLFLRIVSNRFLLRIWDTAWNLVPSALVRFS